MSDITSSKNPKVKLALDLRDRRTRDELGLFLIEGFREVSRAVQNGQTFEIFFFCPEFFLGKNEGALIEKIKKQRGLVLELAPSVFKKISYRDRPDGLIAISKIRRESLSDLPKKNNPLYVVAEAIEKPGNLGTILRSSDGVGADGVIVADRCTDIFNPNVVRASVGTLFTLPVIETSKEEAYSWLKENHIQIVATTPSTELEFTEADLSGPVAIVMGTEQLGLSSFWLDKADIKVKIPMLGVSDSLNVATATTLMLYEALRQRRSLRR